MSLRPQGNYLLLLDASSFVHRAYHAMPKLTRRCDGLQTGALAGLCRTFLKLFRLNYSPIGSLPRYGAVIMDTRGKNFRHEIFPEYKAQRKPYEADLEAQLPWIPVIAKAFNVPAIAAPGYEADDLIATYVRLAAEEGLDVVIASSDKDLCQLVWEGDDHRTIMYDAMKDKGPEDNAAALIGVAQVRDKFGVSPLQMVDFQAIVGDAVDNVPGCPKIGPKGAARLLTEFDDVFTMIDEASWGAERFANEKEADRILTYADDIKLSRRLVQLDENVPVDLSIDDLWLSPAIAQEVRALLIDLELMHLVDWVDRPAKA